MIRIKKLVHYAAGLVLRMFIVFIVLEGLCSVVIIVGRFMSTIDAVRAGGRHAQYDPEIGWVNIPSFHGKDIYGPGGDVTTNSVGYRGASEFGAIPPGKLRVVCSGDSFTFGYGVGDDDTFCHGLTREDPRMETANLGIPGYGIDQAFLLYRREAPRLAHDVHLFSFIQEDFTRMSASTFLGAGKPVLHVQNGALTVDNVPVPRGGYATPGLTRTLAAAQLSRAMVLYSRIRSPQREPSAYRDQDQQIATGLFLFDELNRLAVGGQVTLVAVYLPTLEDLSQPPLFQSYLSKELDRRGLLFFDLTDEFKALPPAERDTMFISNDVENEQFAAGHYSVAGNRLAAKALYRRLAGLPAIAERLARPSSTPRGR